ncbi:MAG: twin-arginine translocase TatA/TatE family subunit, partial [Verrucomicrobia bacterium]|nr:twin-arginine translocase TatA/TatE family subunit [Verrucomicrobiota bacterium]
MGIAGFELPAAFISPGGGELIMIMLVLILLFGAKDAPRIFRNIQTFLDKMQRSASDFRYKMMYGDLHSNTPAEEPYEVDDETSDEEDDTHWMDEDDQA